MPADRHSRSRLGRREPRMPSISGVLDDATPNSHLEPRSWPSAVLRYSPYYRYRWVPLRSSEDYDILTDNRVYFATPITTYYQLVDDSPLEGAEWSTTDIQTNINFDDDPPPPTPTIEADVDLAQQEQEPQLRVHVVQLATEKLSALARRIRNAFRIGRPNGA
ncbi:hypothetical protein Moror_380 [Moniliophthora roreri MCA 2997]|uniref:Uncharacterized protein n=1 Tax=Moniliophthora roreri (strain MCA 2997) TaxID=1381753 RepID=V2Z2F8_MONRO|nr:hypothetical protein Moror_380 [Moniliophthora roreri MCA 2997]